MCFSTDWAFFQFRFDASLLLSCSSIFCGASKFHSVAIQLFCVVLSSNQVFLTSVEVLPSRLRCFSFSLWCFSFPLIYFQFRCGASKLLWLAFSSFMLVLFHWSTSQFEPNEVLFNSFVALLSQFEELPISIELLYTSLMFILGSNEKLLNSSGVLLNPFRCFSILFLCF